jgi:hypothetical protein
MKWVDEEHNLPLMGSFRALRAKIKAKVKLSLCLNKHHAMKTYWENGDIAPRIPDLSARWRYGSITL